MCLRFVLALVLTAWSVMAAVAPVIADYAAAIPELQARADGRVHTDAAATLAAVRDLHANTYFYLVHGQMDWDDMEREFLPAAHRAGVDVWLYLVPPSECRAPCVLPYGNDYIRIAAETARLGLRYPNLKGIAIDDFADNLTLYTPEYVARMRAAGRDVNPAFKFYPLLYWRSMLPEFLDRYAPAIDGVVFAYRDEPTINTSRNTSLREQLDAAESLTRARSKDLVLMVYCAPLGRLPIPPSAAYVRDAVAMGLEDTRAGKLTGVVTYKLSKTGQPAPAGENYSHTGRGRATILATGRGIPEGSHGEISTAIAVTSGPAALRFWRTTLYAKMPPGYFFLQLLVDDRVAWERDVAEVEPKVWKQERVDLGSALSGKSTATLRLRLAAKRTTGSMTLLVGADDLEPEGFRLPDPGLEDPTKWTATQNAPMYMPLVQYFDPARPVRMLEAVRELYARYGVPNRRLP